MNQDATAALAAELLPRVAQGCAENLQFIGVIASGIDQMFSQNIEERMNSARDKAGAAFNISEEYRGDDHRHGHGEGCFGKGLRLGGNNIPQ